MNRLVIQRFLLFILVIAGPPASICQESLDVELVCPDHVTINCEAELEEISNYGQAMYRVGEERSDMEDQQSKRSIDECGKGTIERIWRYKSEDEEEHKCSQFIFIGVNKSRKPLIKWPTKEVVVSWCDPSYTPSDLPDASRRPKYFHGECNKMEHTYSDEIVYLSESCKEVHRNWVVHDWCYDSKTVKGNDGHYKFTQIIKFEIPNDIDFLSLKDIEVEATDCEKAVVDMPDMKASIQDCNRRLKISNDSQFAEIKGKNASGTYPVGETVITYLVELECTPPREIKQRIIVTDPCKAKAIIEQKELAVKLSQSFVRPNPFINETEILLANDKPQDAVITLYKTNGERIFNETIKLEVGMQKISVTNEELKLPGVYLYSIMIGERKLEGRLIKIR